MTSVHERLVMTDIGNWPAAVRAFAWRKPALSLDLAPGPQGWLDVSDTLPGLAPCDLMPKLALKSWQESGRLRMIPGGLPLAPAIAARLATPTHAQRVVLQAWDTADTPPQLHLFPWADMSAVTELRWRVVSGQAENTSCCYRNTRLPDTESLSEILGTIHTEMPALGAFIAQLAVPATGPVRLIDLNPALTARQLAALAGGGAV